MKNKIKVATSQTGEIIGELPENAHIKAIKMLQAHGVRCLSVKKEFLSIPGQPRSFAFVPANGYEKWQ